MDYKEKTKDELIKDLQELQQKYDLLMASGSTDSHDPKLTYLSITLNSIGNGVISTDKKGLIVQLNPIAEKLCGWTLAEAIGKPIAEVFNIIHSETRKPVSNPVKKVLETGKIVGLANHTILVSREGIEYQISDSAAPIKNKEGEDMGVILVFSDITEQYLAQKQIKESEERYSRLLQNLEAGIIVHAPDTSIVMSNLRAAELLGLSIDQMKGKEAIDPIWNFVNEEKSALAIEDYPVNRVIASKKPILNQIIGISRLNTKNIVWISVNGFPLFDTKGRLSEIVTNFIDISDSVQAELMLRDEKERIRTILDFVVDPIFLKDNKHRIIFANRAFLDLFGLDESKVIGYTLAENVPENEREHFLSVDRSVLDTGIFDAREEELTLGDFSRTIITKKTRFIDESGNRFLVGSIHDITERKLAEEKLAHSHDLMNYIIEHVKSAVAVHDRDMRYIYVSQRYLHEYNVKEQDIIGKHHYDVFPDLPQKWKDVHQKALAGEVSGADNDPYEREDGSVDWTRWECRPWYERDDVIGGIIVYTEVITERKQSVEALKESEGRWRSLTENSPNHIMLLDTNYEILFVNYTVPDLTIEQVIGKSIMDFVPVDDSQIASDCFERVKQSGNSDRYETKYILADGETQYFDVLISPVKGEGESIIGFISTSNNITQRKQSEDQLKESEEKYRMLVNYSGDPIFVFNRDETYRFVNEAFASPFGKNPDDIIGKSPHAIFSFEEAEKRLAIVRHVFEFGEKREIEVKVVSESGDERHFLTMADPIKDKSGKTLWVSCISKDITQRKLAETELLLTKEAAETNSANITAVIEGTKDSIWAFNRNFEILYINQIFQQEYQQTFGIWLEPGVSLIESLSEELRPIWKPRYERTLNNEQFTVEDSIDTGDGIIYIEISFNPILIKDKVIGGSCIGSNITARKLAEIELIKAKEQAQESDRLKSAFLANMSHEIRTPMNGILGFAGLLKEPELNGDKQLEYIDIIEKSGKRMLNIINDIVDISKIEAGLMSIDLQESNINEQIEYVYTFFKPEVEAKGMKLLFQNPLPFKEAIIKTDREKFFAILTNLVKNAIKHTEKGSIEFGYTVEETLHESLLQFYVKDTGSGIPKNRQEAIFDRFIQADIEDLKAKQGAGLGLAITKSYIEMLGGRIWLESVEGHGSTFYFSLPFNAEQNEKIVRKEDIVSDNSFNMIDGKVSGLKILIAEDDEISVSLIRIYVEKISKEIIKSISGHEAIEACRNNPDIDLILMDIQLPSMSGYEATRQIRKFNKEVIIIAQTAYGLAGDREKALEAGCNDYISKPINKTVLISIIQKYFNK